MRKFKEGNSEKPLDEKRVEKHKDFDHLITNYQEVINHVHKKPLYKSKKGFLIILLIILVLTAITIAIDEAEKNHSKGKVEQQR